MSINFPFSLEGRKKLRMSLKFCIYIPFRGVNNRSCVSFSHVREVIERGSVWSSTAGFLSKQFHELHTGFWLDLTHVHF